MEYNMKIKFLRKSIQLNVPLKDIEHLKGVVDQVATSVCVEEELIKYAKKLSRLLNRAGIEAQKLNSTDEQAK